VKLTDTEISNNGHPTTSLNVLCTPTPLTVTTTATINITPNGGITRITRQ
jgi:hypothetical protein